MVGAALVRRLAREDCEILTAARDGARSAPPGRGRGLAAREARPDAVFVAAATVGGILANDTRPAEFLYDNLVIADQRRSRRRAAPAWRSCCSSARPASIRKLAPQPIREDALLTGPLEPTNEWYAIAKIAGIKLCQAYRRQYGCDFISAMPTNLYGPGDNFDLDVEPRRAGALMARSHERQARPARASVEIWGTGPPRREFLHVDDPADALRLPDASTIRTRATSMSARGEDLTDRASWPTRSREWSGFHGALRLRHRQARRHAAQAARRHPARRARLARLDLA